MSLSIIFFVISILFVLVFGVFIVAFVLILSKGASRNRQNRQAPVLTVPATVVTRRTHVWGDHSHTNYYVTFQVDSGDRMELHVPYDQFGYLVEGDRGELTFQGTRLLWFRRF